MLKTCRLGVVVDPILEGKVVGTVVDRCLCVCAVGTMVDTCMCVCARTCLQKSISIR